VVAGIVICGLGGPAHGDRADRADQLFKKGKKLLAQKRYPEACTAFEDSDRIDPGIGAKLNVAKCYQEWGKLATAWRWFTDAEQMANDTKDDRARKIHALVVELDASVPRLTVKAPRDAGFSGVVVKLDGVALDTSALGVERRVDPGPHQIDTIVDGAKQTKVIPIERAGTAEVTLELPTKTTARSTSGPGAATEVAPDPGRTRRRLGFGVSGAGVFAMGVAGIVTLRARDDYQHALTVHCQGATDMCDDIGLTASHGARRRANIATVMTFGGLAAIAGGLIVYFTAPTAPRAAEHALYLAPSIGGDGVGDGGGDGVGVVLGGAF
jgi:hypothetical protein